MSARVFRLGDVPLDEANGVRQALADAGIEFYPSPPGSPGISHGTHGPDAAAILVADDAASQARIEIDNSQREWQLRARTQQTQNPMLEATRYEVVFRAIITAGLIYAVVASMRVFLP
jgi:hypothetical protein